MKDLDRAAADYNSLETSYSILAGDFRFDSKWKKEEAVLTDNDLKDQLHDFISGLLLLWPLNFEHQADHWNSKIL